MSRAAQVAAHGARKRHAPRHQIAGASPPARPVGVAQERGAVLKNRSHRSRFGASRTGGTTHRHRVSGHARSFHGAATRYGTIWLNVLCVSTSIALLFAALLIFALTSNVSARSLLTSLTRNISVCHFFLLVLLNFFKCRPAAANATVRSREREFRQSGARRVSFRPCLSGL